MLFTSHSHSLKYSPKGTRASTESRGCCPQDFIIDQRVGGAPNIVMYSRSCEIVRVKDGFGYRYIRYKKQMILRKRVSGGKRKAGHRVAIIFCAPCTEQNKFIRYRQTPQKSWTDRMQGGRIRGRRKAAPKRSPHTISFWESMITMIASLILLPGRCKVKPFAG